MKRSRAIHCTGILCCYLMMLLRLISLKVVCNFVLKQMIIERQVMAENKSEFVFASCQLVNVWAGKKSQEERVRFVTEVRNFTVKL